jgi:hypothetical protein
VCWLEGSEDGLIYKGHYKNGNVVITLFVLHLILLAIRLTLCSPLSSEQIATSVRASCSVDPTSYSSASLRYYTGSGCSCSLCLTRPLAPDPFACDSCSAGQWRRTLASNRDAVPARWAEAYPSGLARERDASRSRVSCSSRPCFLTTEVVI